MLAQHEVLLPLAHAIGGQATLFDLPGHGQSDDWDGKTPYQAQAANIAAGLCDGPTHVVGHSYGATVALRLAVERPELVSGLTLIEPVFFAAARGTEGYAAHIRSFQPFVAAMLQGDEAKAAEVFNEIWSETSWSGIPMPVRTYLENRIHLVVASNPEIDEDHDGIVSPARLSQVDVPVTLIRGAQTQPVIAAIHDHLVTHLPDATDHVIKGAGHMLPIRKAFVPQLAALIRAKDPEIA